MASKRFALLWLLGLMAFTPGLTVLGLYKRFGMASGAIVAVSFPRGLKPITHAARCRPLLPCGINCSHAD